MEDRLAKSDWVAEGLRTLEREGAHALKAVPLAEKLGVSRGSFYWHFKDIADFHGHVLEAWREHLTAHVIVNVEAKSPAPYRLQELIHAAFDARTGLERAIRAWASTDKAVARTVASVDEQRIGYIAALLQSAGVQKAKAVNRATFLNWAYLGRAVATGKPQLALSDAALRDIVDLFER